MKTIPESEDASRAYYFELVSTIKAFDKSITEVRDLEILGLYNYVPSDYPQVLALIKQNKFDEIKAMYIHETKTFADLTVVSFSNQNSTFYIAVFYDNDDLWQDPKVLELFKR